MLPNVWDIQYLYMRDIQPYLHGGSLEVFMPNAGLHRTRQNDRGLSKNDTKTLDCHPNNPVHWIIDWWVDSKNILRATKI